MPDYRAVVPGLFTMGNLVCGFLSILSIIEGNPTIACWFVILAGFLDALDGKVARLSGSSSQFGVELDSLADFLSFGVAPAVVAFSFKLTFLGKWDWVIPVIFIMSAAYRLARFNLMADTEEKREFHGLPAPAAGFALVSYVLFSFDVWGSLAYQEVLIIMIILCSFLMVTQVEYDTIPDHFGSKKERLKLVIVIVACLAMVLRPRLLLFPFVGLYILIGLVREIYRLFFLGVDRVRGRQQNQVSIGDSEERE